jgi:hypothetical protein
MLVFDEEELVPPVDDWVLELWTEILLEEPERVVTVLRQE